VKTTASQETHQESGPEPARRRVGVSLPIPLPLFVALALFAALAIGALIAKSTGVAVFGVLILGLSLTVSQRPLVALSFLLVLIPFSEIPLLADKLVSIPGARPALLLGAFVIGIAVINLWKASVPDRLSAWFAAGATILFVVAVARSVGYLDTLNAFWPEDDMSVQGYILSYCVKHIIYFFPFVVVVLYVQKRKDVVFMIQVLVGSITLLSLYFLYYYTFKVENKGVIDLAWEYAGDALGLHKNAASAIYVIIFPLCLSRFFVKKDFLGLGLLALSLLSIAFLYSRTAYVTAVMSWILYLVISKRTKYLPVFLFLGAGVVLLLSTSMISESIIDRATSRIDTGDINAISAGRLDLLWIPLAQEYLQHPVDILLGKGRYAMLTTAAARQGFILGASHPHNMFIEQILDAGLIGLSFFLSCFALILYRTYRSLHGIVDTVLKEYQVGIVVAIISFLAGGMTQGTLFPDLENTNIWAVLGLGLVISGWVKNPRRVHNE